MKTRSYFVVLFALCASFLSIVTHAVDDFSARLSVEQLPLYTAVPPVTGELTVSGTFNKQAYIQGDFAKLNVTVRQPANQTAFIALVQAYPDGRVVRLFPNQYQPNNQVLGNNSFEIRGSSVEGLYVNDPQGAYLVKLIASTNQENLNDLLANVRSASQLASDLKHAGTHQTGTLWNASGITYLVTSGASVVNAPLPQPVSTSQPLTISPSLVVVAPTPTPVTQPITQGYLASQLALKTSAFNVSLAAGNSQTNYLKGQNLTFQMSSEKDCNAGLIHENPQGQISVLYPNQVKPEVELDAGEVAWLPGSDGALNIVATDIGQNSYMLVCTNEPGFFDALLGFFGQKSTAAKPTMTVEQLLADSKKFKKAYAITTINVQ